MTEDEAAKLAANQAAEQKAADLAAQKVQDNKTAQALALRKEKITIGALIALTVFWLIGLGLMLIGWSAAIQITGFWILIGGLIGGSGYLAFRFARVVVGSAWPEFHGDREIAVGLAFLVAFLLSPATLGDLGNGGVGLMRGLVFESPYLAANKAPNYGAPAKLYDCIVDKNACEYVKNVPGAKIDASVPGTGIDLSWASFAITLAIALVVARGLRGARRDFFGKLSAEGSDDEDADAATSPDKGSEKDKAKGKKQPRFITQVLMNYPTWVAFCIYALILIPATYLAVGSLLYLRLDTPVASLSALARDLDEVEREIMATPGVSVELRPLADELNRVERILSPAARADIETGRTAISQGYKYNITLTNGRPGYEEVALSEAGKYKASATSSQFEDFKSVQLARYETAIRDTRAAARPCLDALNVVAKQIEATRAGTPTTAAPDTNANQASAPIAPLPLENLLRQRLREAGNLCKTESEIAFPKPVKPQDLEPSCTSDDSNTCVRPDRRFPEVMYSWLASSTDATILIVGLVGFGLFGSAIRMMGRVDAPNVSAAVVLKAQDDAYMARQQLITPTAARQAARALLDSQRTAADEAATIFKKANEAATTVVQDVGAAETRVKTALAVEALAKSRREAATREADTLQAAIDAIPVAERPQEQIDGLITALVARDTAVKEHDSATATATEASTALDDLNKRKLEISQALDKAREAFVSAQTKNTELQKAWEAAQAEWKTADDKASTAEAYHQQLRSSLVADRSNIVVRRRRSTGDLEYAISGAPARVLVQGLGAAFTSFLAGQAGVHILTDGGRTNAYSLLLSCFVGAVFAEEIWKWARRYLPSDRTAPAPGSEGKTSAPSSDASQTPG